MMKIVKREIFIQNRKGLHARASAKIVNIAEFYKATTYISYQDMRVPAESIMGLLMLGAGLGASILIESEGEQAEEVVESITNLIKNKFGEL